MLVNMSGGKVEEITEVVQPDLLWTNASPTSAFALQTISVDGAAYDAYLVEVRNAYNSDDRCVGFVPITTTRRMIGVLTGNLWGWRDIQGATANTVVFGAGYYTRPDTLGTYPNNSYGIPTRIWGVKYTL